MPHGHCYLWKPDILGLTVLGDGLTGMAYYTLPFMLFYIVKKREDLAQRNMFLLFAMFIMACGTTHFIDIWTVWFPTYRLADMVTMATGVVSVVSAVALFRALPQILTLPSNSRLEKANQQLLEEITKKEEAQAALRKVNDELELRVQQRTAQLIRANRELEKEIEMRKRIEKNIFVKNAELIRINSDLDNFVYCASHDLKSPIINAKGLITALNEELPVQNAQVSELVDRLENSIDRMHYTVQDLTEVSTIKGAEKADFKELYFVKLLEEVKLDLANEIAATGVEITSDFDAAGKVYFTHKNLKSIIYNLLSNAIKYRAADRPVQVKLITKEVGNYLILAVTDNGIGIDLVKHEKKIFSLFKRLHENIEGSGVGLYIVKRIMEFNQGRVEVESKLGQGATFKVYFPK
jgi:signal transduction histidine kinase